jgi:hypothetical protein
VLACAGGSWACVCRAGCGGGDGLSGHVGERRHAQVDGGTAVSGDLVHLVELVRLGGTVPSVPSSSEPTVMHVCALGRLVTRVCAMTSAVVARLIYQMLLARMSPGQ